MRLRAVARLPRCDIESPSTAPSTFVGLLSYGSMIVVAYRTVLSGAIARTVAGLTRAMVSNICDVELEQWFRADRAWSRRPLRSGCVIVA